MRIFFKQASWWWLAAAALAGVLAAVGLGNSSQAAGRFDKPITLVVTFPPGGGTDLLARKLGAALQQRIGQSVIVENRPGASGNIGARHVAEARGDGSTLLMVNSSFAINPAVYRHLDFDPRHDFRALLNVGTIASVLVVPQASSLHNLADARAAAQAQSLPFASCGNGTPQHMAGEMLAQAAGLQLQHVPYKGCGPAVTAVAAGQVPMGVVTASSAAPLVESGRMRAIAITAPERLPQWPQVPTVAEQGVAGFAVEQWHGLLAPAATSDALLQQMHAVLAQILAEPTMQQSLRDQGYTPVQQSAAQFGQTIASDIDRYAAVVQQLGLRID